MANEFKLPDKKAAIFWPVGCGDSTTLVLKPGEAVMQIDLRHLEKADDENNPEWPIIDDLVRVLPKPDDKPYLSLFVLTHPDKDHIQGFAELLEKVTIGEIWHTPRIFRDQDDQDSLCEDAKVFREEARRRRKAIKSDPNNVKAGDRLRVIGHDDILNENRYKDLPDDCKSRPGEIVSAVDGEDLSKHFEAFIHAPFKDDQAKNKNNTSLSLNITIREGEKHARFFFFGDREYPTIKRIFETTEEHENEDHLYWDVMLSAHHCSKAIMHWQDEGDEEEEYKKDLMEYFEKYARSDSAYIVSSSHSTFSDDTGCNPPHKKARKQYEKIVQTGRFICTHEYPKKDGPRPLVFTIDSDGFGFDDERETSKGPTGLAATVDTARGGQKPPTTQIGFGRQ